MYAEINCINPHEINSKNIWEDTQELLKRKAAQLRNHNPDLMRSEIHLKASSNKTSARLIFHDRKKNIMETHVKDRDLNKAISGCFAKAERVLQKLKKT